jgi:CubicO group peptidase (beta-lactamase class C family)
MRFVFPVKIIVIIALSIVLFLGEITSTFPFKRDNNINIPSLNTASFAHRINNSFSSYPGTFAIDSIINDFLKKNHIKGASVAITRKGQLVYARGFGYANYMDSIETIPSNLFRIASVSKLITATAIMKLAENGKLNLEDKVFGKNGWLNDSIFLKYADNRVEKITIQHLLTHTAGWNHKRNDPAFGPLVIAKKLNLSKPAGKDELIQYVLRQKLDFVPGRQYNYSNTGYCILGKIIEKASGMPYEDYVKFAVLQPLGIYNMQIGRSFPEEMPPDEVIYYINEKLQLYPAFDGSGARVPLQYGGNNIELLGPAGGWIASAPELAKFIVAVDGFSGYPDLLSRHSIKIMTRSYSKNNQLIGWRGSDGKGTWWRTGTLAGTAALVMRFNNELNWIILLNTTPDKKSSIHNELSRTIYQCMQKVKDWPSIDLFAI